MIPLLIILALCLAILVLMLGILAGWVLKSRMDQNKTEVYRAGDMRLVGAMLTQDWRNQ